jgi:Uma2 family endonuclease
MTIDEFVRLYADEGPFEIIDGARIPLSPQISGSSTVAKMLYDAILLYLREREIGEVYFETVFILPATYSAQWVFGSRTPDILVYAGDRLAQYKASTPNWQDKPFMLVPDLVAEIVSPTDNLNDVDRKIDAYLADGVRVVWQVNPTRRKVSIHLPGSDQQTNLSGGAILTGGDLLPGFQIALAALFGD